MISLLQKKEELFLETSGVSHSANSHGGNQTMLSFGRRIIQNSCQKIERTEPA
jgi:hypothetical protein